MFVKTYLVNLKELEGKKFYYVDFGSETHGRTSFRLWVSPKLLKKDDEGRFILEFPVVGARVDDGKKANTKILRPDSNKWVADIYVECGFRGGSDIVIIAPENVKVDSYYVYASPRGNLGVSTGALVTVPIEEKLRFRWERSGRLYGNPSTGVVILDKDGQTEKIDQVDEELLCDLEDIADVSSTEA